MNIQQYQQYVQQGMSSSYNLPLAACGLAGEVGEVCDVIKKHGIYEGRKDKRPIKDLIMDEGGDALWQLMGVFCIAGIDIQDVIDFNVQKLNARHGGAKLDVTGGKRE